MGLKEYLVKRSIYLIITIYVIITLNFLIFRIMPGDPVSMLVAEQVIRPEMVEQIKRLYGLDLPLWQQYVLYIRNLFVGNLGFSFQYLKPVVEVIFERLTNTVILMGGATLSSILLGTLMGVISAWRRGRRADIIILFSSLFFRSVPVYWLGILLLMMFSYQLGLFPTAGTMSRPPPTGFIPLTMDYLSHLFLPMVTIMLVLYGTYTLISRNSLLDILTQDYILIAKAKGLSSRAILFKHALRNAMLPLVTTFAISLGYVVGGAVMTETVFSWRGVGRLIFDSVTARDYPILQGAFFIISLTVILANFAADLLYGFLDPRVKY
jgi:peptide/nickel transport system permease protein